MDNMIYNILQELAKVNVKWFVYQFMEAVNMRYDKVYDIINDEISA